MQVKENKDFFSFSFKGLTLIEHSYQSPCVYLGTGEKDIKMYRGNFDIKDYLVERIPLRYFKISKRRNGYSINFKKCQEGKVILVVKINTNEKRLEISFDAKDDKYNRFWLRVAAQKEEKIYGCGEQLTYFNLRGKNFPLWTSEPGVGRNKKTITTWKADSKDRAGGDYYTTNFPQPTFISTQKYYFHMDTTAYADFNFKNKDFHEFEVWDIPNKIIIETGESYLELIEKLTALLGRQPELPEWIYKSFILGIQGGYEFVEKTLKKLQNGGVDVSALWCQDWQGVRHTSMGKRLMWNWECDETLYPDIKNKIKKLKERGVRFMGYVNPYVAEERNLYEEASRKGYLATNNKGEDYLVDFGEFYCGIVDFTKKEAVEWYKKVIKENMIDMGLDGWMADFGEYLPIDCNLHNGKDAMIMHNAWPAIWAKVNFDAVKESGKLGEIVYFMRAGYTGSQKYATLIWAGDQSVNWDLDDGLASVVPAALSLGMTGHGLHHSDIGGYTSLHGNIRSKELFLRWAEISTFTPIMRTHEGNRPSENFQLYNDDDTIKRFARLVDIHKNLSPYLKKLIKINSEKGIPVQRPLFLHYENDQNAFDIKYQYLLGRDILVAPVYEEKKKKWRPYLPKDNWVHLWSGQEYNKGEVEVKAEIGYPPVFYRKDSKYKELFEKIAEI